jgi:hypothetical protein
MFDDASDTLRDMKAFSSEAPTDPDATSIYDLNTFVPVVRRSPRRRRQIRDTRENVLRLREAISKGWDVLPELAYEEQQLALLEAA